RRHSLMPAARTPTRSPDCPDRWASLVRWPAAPAGPGVRRVARAARVVPAALVVPLALAVPVALVDRPARRSAARIAGLAGRLVGLAAVPVAGRPAAHAGCREIGSGSHFAPAAPGGFAARRALADHFAVRFADRSAARIAARIADLAGGSV